MAKHTKRDYVWKAALACREPREGGVIRFSVRDVVEEIESMYTPGIDGPPDVEFVHDVLVTMTDLGELDGQIDNTHRSRFSAPPRLRRPSERLESGPETPGGAEPDRPPTLD